MVRGAEGGAAVEVEVWELPSRSSALSHRHSGTARPGKVQLADGRWETGFICEPYTDGARTSPNLAAGAPI